MKDELISIIIPVYNAEEYISNCLDSVLQQTYTNIEVICVNDGSTDRSIELLEYYRQRDDRLIIVNKVNSGVSRARNTALEIARGTYVMFVDADDWIDENTCEKAFFALNKSSADVVIFSYIRERNGKSYKKIIFEEPEIVFDQNDCKYKLERRLIGLVDDELKYPDRASAIAPVWGKLYKSKIIQDNVIRFTDLNTIGSYEDGLFNIRYFHFIKKAIFIHDCLYHYRKQVNTSLTSLYKPDMVQKNEMLYKYMEHHINCEKLDDSYRAALSNRISMSLLGNGLNIINSNQTLFYKTQQIRQFIMRDYYKSSIVNLKTTYMPIHWRVFYWLAKRGCALGVYILLIFIRCGIV